MTPNDDIYKLALANIPGVNADFCRELEQREITPGDFFGVLLADGDLPGSSFAFDEVDTRAAIEIGTREYHFDERHGIRRIFFSDPEYPPLLRECRDAPVLLHVLGEADLSGPHMLAMVGTRKCTDYGVSFCRRFLSDLVPSFPDLCVVSGLAYGIDAAAHSYALESGATTIAVVAHGLDMIYPSQHRELARRIIKSGGAIVSEYRSGTRPYRGHFLERNRIVAGMSQTTFVVESEVKGGAMNTATTALSYDRMVFALPGRVSDRASLGCNTLVARNVAKIFTSVDDFMDETGWTPAPVKDPPINQPSLFSTLSPAMQSVIKVMEASQTPLSIDSLQVSTGLGIPALMEALADLEFDDLISKLPGARYALSPFGKFQN